MQDSCLFFFSVFGVWEKKQIWTAILFHLIFHYVFCLCFLHWCLTNKIENQHPTLTPVGWLSQGRTEYCNDNNNSMEVKWLKVYLHYESLWISLIEISIFSFESLKHRVILLKITCHRTKKNIFRIGNNQVSIIPDDIGTDI